MSKGPILPASIVKVTINCPIMFNLAVAPVLRPTVPKAETVVLAGVYDNYTELTRDGLAWTVENGRVFYFRPGHETFPIYHMPEVKKIVENTVRWLAKAT